MADVFAYNGDSFLPEYLPGLIGYGQRGADGNNGATGASVHYSSLNVLVYQESNEAGENSTQDVSVLTTEMDHVNSEVINLILRGKELSNNGYSSRNVEYMVNDIIIDRTGRFYIIKTIDKEKEIVEINSIDEYGKSNYSIITNTFTGFSAYCSTTFLKTDGKKWVQPNPLFSGDEYINGTHSPKVYHANDLAENIYGNFINFSLSYAPGADISNYTYKFVLSFPNGQTVEAYSPDPYKSIFIDNRYVFGCFDTNGWANSYNFSIHNLEKVKTGLSGNDDDLSEYSNLVESYMKMGDYMKCRGAVYNEEYNDDIANKANTVLCSFFIKYNCSAYAEIIDSTSSVVYRIDLDDIFISKSGNQIVNNRPIIEESGQTTNWSVNNYTYNAGEFLLSYEDDDEKRCMFNPMHSFVFVPTEENIDDAADIRTLSEDGIIESVYFTDASGLAHYTGWGEAYGKSSTPENSYGSNGNCFSGANDGKYNLNGVKDALREIVDEITMNKQTPLTAKGNTLTKSNFDSVTERNEFISSAIRYKYGVIPYNRVLDEENPEQDAGFREGTYIPYTDCNRTIKLKFKNVSSVTINVIYLKQQGLIHPDTEEELQYASTKVYIGYIDHPLVVNKSDNTTEPAGIYYLTKIVPPGYTGIEEGSDECSNAGIADLTINVADFGLNPRDEHYIEIGVTPLDTIDSSGIPRTRDAINQMHPSPVTVSPDTASDFYAPFLTDEGCTPTPELKIYISRIDSLGDDYVEENDEVTGEEEEEDLNIFNNIRKDFPLV